MSDTQVVFKPGGVIVLVVVLAGVVAAGIAGLQKRGRDVPSVANPMGVAVAGAPAMGEPVDEFGLTAGEVRDREVLANLNSTPGQARDWLFLGPLPSGITITNMSDNQSDAAKMRKIVNTSYLPAESKYRASGNSPVTLGAATYRWRKARGSAFNFKEMFDSKETPYRTLSNVVVYGYATIESKGVARKTLRFRSDDGAIVWVNGQQVYFGDKIRGVETMEDIIPLQLRPGRNNVLVKVAQGSGGWAMSFQLENAK